MDNRVLRKCRYNIDNNAISFRAVRSLGFPTDGEVPVTHHESNQYKLPSTVVWSIIGEYEISRNSILFSLYWWCSHAYFQSAHRRCYLMFDSILLLWCDLKAPRLSTKYSRSLAGSSKMVRIIFSDESSQVGINCYNWIANCINDSISKSWMINIRLNCYRLECVTGNNWTLGVSPLRAKFKLRNARKMIATLRVSYERIIDS